MGNWEPALGSAGRSWGSLGASAGVLVAMVLSAGCRTADGPTRSDVLSNLEAALDPETDSETLAFPVPELDSHLWGGWHAVQSDERVLDELREASALELAGLREDALEVLTRAYERNDEIGAVLEARGAVYASLGFQRAAAGDFQRAVWVSPQNGSAWMALGRMHQELDLNEQALDELERARELGVEGFDLELVFARSYRGLGRRGQSATHYTLAIQSTETPQVELFVEAASLACEDGADMIAAEDLDQALDLVDRALEEDPRSSQAWFVRALLLEAADEPAGTVASYLRALEIDPECVAAWTNLALLSLRLGDPETSGDAAQRALALETSPERRRALRRLLANR